ncbi:MAG: hypothetical protein DRJ52_08840 [Thermoprotei archaeon]|nr:MAG: hypothetical protein DRJ52_08840 [Thermoprotei archaeon]RLE99299.1 MAG: hypothetical protein DRJ63_05785 [Thermoprotei archaeon]
MNLFVKELTEEFYSKVLPKLSALVDETTRFLYFLAWLNTRLEEEGLGRIIIVGGFAVEVYSGAAYRTLDVDIVVEGEKSISIVREFLEKICGEDRGRVLVPKLRVLAAKGIDIVGRRFIEPKEPTVLKINSLKIYLESVEELIVKYLCAWKYWKADEDRSKVFILIKVYWSKLDKEYLYKRAREEDVLEKLEECFKALGLR